MRWQRRNLRTDRVGAGPRTWTPGQLKSLSSHYERVGESLDDATIKSIIKSKSVNQGLFQLRQIFHGLYDSELARRSLYSDSFAEGFGR